MGGHGALVSFLRNPGMFRSVSALAPICNPSKCDWGRKAFTGYLGQDQSQWAEWDATELAAKYKGPQATLLVDQGSSDEFLAKGQLLPDNLVAAVSSNPSLKMQYSLRGGYDHSYYFIQSFVEEHIKFHAEHLNKKEAERKDK